MEKQIYLCKIQQILVKKHNVLIATRSAGDLLMVALSICGGYLKTEINNQEIVETLEARSSVAIKWYNTSNTNGDMPIYTN